VSSYEKVRKGGGFLSSRLAIFEKALAGEKGGIPRQRIAAKQFPAHGLVQVFDSLETYRYFGVDDGIDHQYAVPVLDGFRTYP
jgi:hypothetical protein